MFKQLELTDFVNTSSSMVAGPFEAFIDVDFTQQSNSAMGTRALKVVHEIIANSAVLAWVRVTVVDVELAVLALVAFGAHTLVSADEIFASGPILTGI